MFVQNQVIDFASKEKHGVVQIGDGINVTTDGVISVDKNDVGAADWNAMPGESGYIKNRTHYESPKFVWSKTYESGTPGSLKPATESDFDITNPEVFTQTNKDNTGTTADYEHRTYYIKISEIPFGDDFNYGTLSTIIGNIQLEADNREDKTVQHSNVTRTSLSRLSDVDGTNIGYYVDTVKGLVLINNFTGKSTNIFGAIDGQTHSITFPSNGIYVQVHEVRMPSTLMLRAITFVSDFTINQSYVVKLDEKYLPDDLATQTWVLSHVSEPKQSDWINIDAEDDAYIKNKPFGKVPIIDDYCDVSTVSELQALPASYPNSEKVGMGGTVANMVRIGDITTYQSEQAVVDAIKSGSVKVKFADKKILALNSDATISVVQKPIYVFKADGTAVTSPTMQDVYVLYDDTNTLICMFMLINKQEQASMQYLKSGVYLYCQTGYSSPPVHIWATDTYDKKIETENISDNLWYGTEAKYKTERQNIQNDTKVFIIDDQTPITAMLNGSSFMDNSVMYAPITSGTSGQYLVSQGVNKAPIWSDPNLINMAIVWGKHNNLIDTQTFPIPLETTSESIRTTNTNIFGNGSNNSFLIKKAGSYLMEVDMSTFVWRDNSETGSFPLTITITLETNGKKTTFSQQQTCYVGTSNIWKMGASFSIEEADVGSMTQPKLSLTFGGSLTNRHVALTHSSRITRINA